MALWIKHLLSENTGLGRFFKITDLINHALIIHTKLPLSCRRQILSVRLSSRRILRERPGAKIWESKSVWKCCWKTMMRFDRLWSSSARCYFSQRCDSVSCTNIVRDTRDKGGFTMYKCLKLLIMNWNWNGLILQRYSLSAIMSLIL